MDPIITTLPLILAAWLLIVNLIAYAVMASDKSRAKKRRRRVPERTLFAWAAVGGAPGIWIAMKSKRHKTQHRSFRFGVPALFVWNIAAYGALFYVILR